MAITPYNRQVSFALFSAQYPGEPHNGSQMDGEFNAVKAALDTTQDALGDIRTDDGRLKQGIVGVEQLDSTISVAVRAQGVWGTSKNYTANVSVVFQGTKLYLCLVTHMSGVFATDLAAGKWLEVADFGASVLGPDTVGVSELQDNAVDTAAIQDAAVTTNKIASGQVTLAKLASDAQAFMVPTGAILDFAGPTAPTGWLLCNGAAISRTTYAALFAVLGTFHGSGDGSTTFNVPDLRGLTTVGRLDMGGSSGTAIDSTTFGADPTALGTHGGVKNTTLGTGNVPQFSISGTVAITDPNHAHSVTGGIYGGTGNSGNSAAGGGVSYPNTPSAITISAAATGITAAFTGTAIGNASPTAFSRVQPGIILNKIIKT